MVRVHVLVRSTTTATAEHVVMGPLSPVIQIASGLTLWVLVFALALVVLVVWDYLGRR